MIENHVSIVRLVQGYNPYFVTYFLLSHLGKLQFEKWWTGSSGQIELQPTDLGKFILPDSTENGVSTTRQGQIASQISQIQPEITELQNQRKKGLEKSESEFTKFLGIAS
jgi:hypothetical protein